MERELEDDLGHADDISKMLRALRDQPPGPVSPRAAPDRAPGSAFGPYRILSVLGSGAYGVVYKVTDGTRELALKILRPDLLTGDRAMTVQARFEREGRLSAQISHPHVVKAYGFGEHEGALYMACELLPGGSIADLLRDGSLAERRALTLAAQVLEALGAFEDHALIHRDIKPANILLDAAGRAKVSDLGLVRSTSPDYTLLTTRGLTVGTPSYMAPEQIMGSPDLDIRCDLYALGATLFHMLAGRPPFVRANSHDLVQAHLHQRPPDLRLFAPRVSEASAALIERLLGKRREERPASAAEALAFLEEALDQAEGEGGARTPAPSGEETAALNSESSDGQVTAELLVPEDEEGGEPAASRVALRVRGAAGAETLFLFAGRSLVLGRGSGADLRLGHRSASEPGRLDEQISPRHAELRIVGARAEVSDLDSARGTSVDRRRIAPGQAAEIKDWAAIILGGALQVNALKVPDASARPACIKDVGLTATGAPALYLSRPFDGPEHTYALVPGRLRLAVTASGEVAPDSGGRIEVLSVRGALWARDRQASPGRCRRLVPGMLWSVGEHTLEVGASDRAAAT